MDLDGQLKQSAHAQKERVLRTLMDGMGVTRSQATRILHQAQTVTQSSRFDHGHVPDAQDFIDRRPMVKRSDFVVPLPKTDPINPNVNVVPGGGGGGGSLPTVNCLVIGPGAVLGYADVGMKNFTPI